jgi:LysM repeat protein
MIHRDRLADQPEWRPTRRQIARSLTLALLGLAVAPGLALGSEATPAGSETPASAAPADAVARRYVVVRGDTLRAIAARYDTTLAELLALNPELAVNPNLLYPG